MDAEEIKRNLRSLSFSELQEIINVATSLIANRPPKDIPIEYQLAYQAFIYPLQVKTRVPQHLGILKRDAQKEVISALEFLVNWIKKDVGIVVRRTDIKAWFSLFGELLVDFLEERGVPLSLMVMVRQSRSVPGLVEQAFPGYIKAKVLGMVIAAMRRSQDETM